MKFKSKKMGFVSADVEPMPSLSSLNLTGTSSARALALDDPHEGQHPELQSLCVIDTTSMNRIVPNSKPMKLADNDLFEGEVFLMIRTPDVDDPKAHQPTGSVARRISNYKRGKLRRFEFQFRIKLKKIPTGPLFMGCELEHPVKIGRVMKGLSGVLLAMIRRINSGFHYSWGVEEEELTKRELDAGEYEKTHLSFPVEASMDRIVITKLGETPPELGHELFETAESVKRRRKMGSGSVDWNLEDTYTMCLWSAYCDWIQWKSVNVPGVRPFSLSNVTGKQPIYLCVYQVNGITPADYKKKKPPHYRKDLSIFTRLEFSHAKKTEGGLADFKQETDQTDSSEVTELDDFHDAIAESVHSTTSIEREA